MFGEGHVTRPKGCQTISFQLEEKRLVRWRERPRTVLMARLLAVALALVAIIIVPGLTHAFSYVEDADGTYWGIQDAALPVVDTGSIRATQVSPAGQSGAFSTTINGFGGIKVLVPTPTPPPLPAVALLQPGALKMRYNGEMMRGFGLKF